MLGHPIGGAIQSAVHELLSYDDPQGWPTEISRGGEPVFGYSFQEKRRLCSNPDHSGSCGNGSFDVTANWGATLGYYTRLRGGLVGRFGVLGSDYWEDVGPINLNFLQPNLFGFVDDQYFASQDKAQKEFFFFASGGLDLILYSAILQGQFLRSEFTIASSDVKRVVPYASIGVVVGYGKYRISVSHNFRGPEVEGGKSHGWTTLSVSWRF